VSQPSRPGERKKLAFERLLSSKEKKEGYRNGRVLYCVCSEKGKRPPDLCGVPSKFNGEGNTGKRKTTDSFLEKKKKKRRKRAWKARFRSPSEGGERRGRSLDDTGTEKGRKKSKGHLSSVREGKGGKTV